MREFLLQMIVRVGLVLIAVCALSLPAKAQRIADLNPGASEFWEYLEQEEFIEKHKDDSIGELKALISSAEKEVERLCKIFDAEAVEFQKYSHIERTREFQESTGTLDTPDWADLPFDWRDSNNETAVKQKQAALTRIKLANEIIEKNRNNGTNIQADQFGEIAGLNQNIREFRIATDNIREVLEFLEKQRLNEGTGGRSTPDQLSGGQRQRIGTGNAVIRQPAAVLLDETLGQETDRRVRFLDRVFFDLRTGIKVTRGPDTRIGITSFNANFTPLASLDTDAWGPIVKGGLYFGPFPLGNMPKGLTGGVELQLARLKGTSSKSFASFAPGQLPTYIDVLGTGGFGFNNNGLISSDFRQTDFRVSGHVGVLIPVGNGIYINPYKGLFFRHNSFRNSINMTSTNVAQTLSERIRLNQFGTKLGLDVTFPINPRAFFTFGGHGGLAYTNASYRGVDNGNFTTASHSTSRNSWDLLGGLKAALGFYVLCKSAPELAADVLVSAAQAAKKSCMELKATGSYEVLPDVHVQRATTIGGGAVQLGKRNTHAWTATVSIGGSF